MANTQENATNLLGGIPFSNIIGGPLTAAIDAQGMAAMQTFKFVQAVGFEDTNSTATGPVKARSVTFEYSKNGEKYTLTVPLLTLLPIPFLRISNMTINFTAAITANSTAANDTTETTKKALGGDGKTSGLLSFLSPISFNASITKDTVTKSNTSDTYNVQYTMNVMVNAVQDSMPAGMQQLLNILSTAATPARIIEGTVTTQEKEKRVSAATKSLTDAKALVDTDPGKLAAVEKATKELEAANALTVQK
jgi:hypothetical protein